ncbi:ATP-binding cassette domain-containing protein [Saccharospirillum salsuginis]|uniref:Phosphonates import ATP-binding protein PhnC 1 n=1 Tax=Saccharospirillum salsuginis TaxID=418750 RepID=A0A918JYU7_9GAMM|nr:ATP-binding cassette domain-containing protein [Saccharospirillum salsuginis]GGX38808.1 phosphonates import ATP-binding protein PhnC 1 [Saccharospirillum salsuginis]
MTGFRLQQAALAVDGRPILHDLDLTIRPGERVALLGESGAGKTTLLRALRDQHPDRVAWCPQQPGLVPVLSVFHNLYMGRLDRYATAYNLLNLIRPTAARRHDLAKLADRLGLGERLWTPVERLSGGQQSRVNLGRALYQERPVFIGDEPVSSVDERQGADLLGLVCEQHETVVLALHNVDQALTHCNRIIGLRDGRVAFDRPADQLTPAEIKPLYPADAS